MKFKSGDVVSTVKHEHEMTISSIDGDIAFCQYFVETTLHEEYHNIGDLTFLR